MHRWAGLGLVLTLGGAASQPAQQPGGGPTKVGPYFVRQDLMVPMRDGVRLHTIAFRPRGLEGDLAFLFQRTPYGCEPLAGALENQRDNPVLRGGYIVVCQEIRGKFKSEGTFVMQR